VRRLFGLAGVVDLRCYDGIDTGTGQVYAGDTSGVITQFILPCARNLSVERTTIPKGMWGSHQTSDKLLIYSTLVEGFWTVRSAGVDIRSESAQPANALTMDGMGWTFWRGRMRKPERVYGVPWCELCGAH